MDYTVRKAAEVENFMTSVEQVMTYTKLDHEPGYKVKNFPRNTGHQKEFDQVEASSEYLKLIY